jgi:hypothetical protein
MWSDPVNLRDLWVWSLLLLWFRGQNQQQSGQF